MSLQHLKCGGTLVEGVVPYCAKCGKSKATVLKDNTEFEKTVAPADPAPTRKTKKEKPYNPDDVDHSPLNNKESQRAHARWLEINDLRWSAGGRRREIPVWAKIREDTKTVLKMAKEDGDKILANQVRGILIEADEVLNSKRERRHVSEGEEALDGGSRIEKKDDREGAERGQLRVRRVPEA